MPSHRIIWAAVGLQNCCTASPDTSPCAAAPAVFLAAADAASLGRVETVADPYVAPTPTADDYYILRQLAARSRNAESEREQRPAEVLTAPKMYIGASASLQSMQYADSAAAEAAKAAK